MKSEAQINRRIELYKRNIRKLKDIGVPEETIDDEITYQSLIRELEWVKSTK